MDYWKYQRDGVLTNSKQVYGLNSFENINIWSKAALHRVALVNNICAKELLYSTQSKSETIIYVKP